MTKFLKKLPRRDWTIKDINLLRQLWPIYRTSELTTLFDRSYYSLARKAFKLKLKKSYA